MFEVPWIGWMELRFHWEFLSLLQLFKFITVLSKIELDKYFDFFIQDLATILRFSNLFWEKHFEIFLLEALRRYMELAAQFSGWR